MARDSWHTSRVHLDWSNKRHLNSLVSFKISSSATSDMLATNDNRGFPDVKQAEEKMRYNAFLPERSSDFIHLDHSVEILLRPLCKIEDAGVTS